MATHGSVGEFAPGKETWLSYAERLKQYFQANDVQTQEKKRSILLSGCGASSYQLIRNLVSPEKPSEKTFDELAKWAQEHHQPPPSVTVQRFAFHSRNRKKGESIAENVLNIVRSLDLWIQWWEIAWSVDTVVIVCNVYSWQNHRL